MAVSLATRTRYFLFFFAGPKMSPFSRDISTVCNRLALLHRWPYQSALCSLSVPLFHLSECFFSKVSGSTPPALTVYFCNYCGQQGNRHWSHSYKWSDTLGSCTLMGQQYVRVHKKIRQSGFWLDQNCRLMVSLVFPCHQWLQHPQTGPLLTLLITSLWSMTFSRKHQTSQTLYFIRFDF